MSRCGLDSGASADADAWNRVLRMVSLRTLVCSCLDQRPAHHQSVATFSGTDQSSLHRGIDRSLKQVDDAHAFLDMRNDTFATFEGVHRVDHRASSRLRAARSAVERHCSPGLCIFRQHADPCLLSDGIEIVSVGGLIPGFHLNDVTSGLSICRN